MNEGEARYISAPGRVLVIEFLCFRIRLSFCGEKLHYNWGTLNEGTSGLLWALSGYNKKACIQFMFIYVSI